MFCAASAFRKPAFREHRQPGTVAFGVIGQLGTVGTHTRPSKCVWEANQAPDLVPQSAQFLRLPKFPCRPNFSIWPIPQFPQLPNFLSLPKFQSARSPVNAQFFELAQSQTRIKNWANSKMNIGHKSENWANQKLGRIRNPAQWETGKTRKLGKQKLGQTEK